MSIELYKGDLPDNLDLGKVVAIDTETMGLKPRRDKLCLLQISSGDGVAHLVQFDRSTYDCPNLKKLLARAGRRSSTVAHQQGALDQTGLGTDSSVFCEFSTFGGCSQ